MQGASRLWLPRPRWPSRRTLRRARAKAWRAVRGHYMLGVTLALLIGAGLVGAGAFESNGRPASTSSRQQAVASPPSAVFYPVPAPPQPTIIFILVASPDSVGPLFWDNETEDESRSVKNSIERRVLLTRTPEESKEALRLVEETRQAKPDARVLVEDIAGGRGSFDVSCVTQLLLEGWTVCVTQMLPPQP